MSDTILPFITVVMPVLNEARFIENTLLELVNQEYPQDRYEIIVADGGSTDETRAIVERVAETHSQVILMDNPGRLPSSGRNIGFKNGKGDYFLVIDGHCEIRNPQLLMNVVACFQRSGAYCLGRPQPFIIPEAPTMQRAIGLARSSWLGHSSKSFIHSNREGFVSPVSVGCAYRREVFDTIGYVDESFDACEDVEFNYRVEKAGFKTFFSPTIALHYHPREDLSGLWRQMNRYAGGRTRFLRKHPEATSADTFIPSAALLLLTLGPLTWLIQPLLFSGYTLGVGLYLGLILGESVRLGREHGPRFIARLVAASLTVHAGLGYGLLACLPLALRFRSTREKDVAKSSVQLTAKGRQ